MSNNYLENKQKIQKNLIAVTNAFNTFKKAFSLGKNTDELFIYTSTNYELKGLHINPNYIPSDTDDCIYVYDNYKKNIDGDALENIFLELVEEYKELELVFEKEEMYRQMCLKNRKEFVLAPYAEEFLDYLENFDLEDSLLLLPIVF